MTYLLQAGRTILLDFAATLLLLALFAATHNTWLAVGAGGALSLGQIATTLARRQPVDTLMWISLIAVLATGAATLLTHDIRFITLKLSVIYFAVGCAMLKPGWMNRYAPPIALTLTPDLLRRFGFIWAGLMFLTALVNLAVALKASFATWAMVMPAFATTTKLALFLVQFAVMRRAGRARMVRA